jgi:hypothetical protein
MRPFGCFDAACPSLTEVVFYDNPKITPLGLLQLLATISVFTDLNDEPEFGGYDGESVEENIRDERAMYSSSTRVYCAGIGVSDALARASSGNDRT